MKKKILIIALLVCFIPAVFAEIITPDNMTLYNLKKCVPDNYPMDDFEDDGDVLSFSVETDFCYAWVMYDKTNHVIAFNSYWTASEYVSYKRLLNVINEMNYDYLYVRYIVDDQGDIQMEYDLFVPETGIDTEFVKASLEKYLIGVYVGIDNLSDEDCL